VAVAAVVCLPLASRRWRLAGAVGLALALGGALVVPSVRARLGSIGGDETSSVRSLIWSQGVRVIADHPLGVGLGNYSVVVGRYYDVVDPAFNIRTYPHNLWLAAWAEAGPFGLFGYVTVFAALIAGCVAVLRRRAAGDPALAAAGLFGTVAMVVIGMTHDVLYHGVVALSFAGLAGLVLGSWLQGTTATNEPLLSRPLPIDLTRK
jgi:O-antigen ligase